MAVPDRFAGRDMPTDFGPWQTVWKRHHRFSFDGTYQRILDACARLGRRRARRGCERLLSVDSTVVRAQHAAGAPAAVHRGLSRLQESGDPSPTTTRLGRPRRVATKIHALTDTATCPVAIARPPGRPRQSALSPLVDGYLGAERAPTRPATSGSSPTGVRASVHPGRAAPARDQPHDPRARRPDRPPQNQRLGWRPPTGIIRNLQAVQHRRTRLPPAQPVARNRHPPREYALDLPRRRTPRRHRSALPAPPSTIRRHALATECELSATFRRNLAVERLRSDSQAAIGGRQIRCALCPMP